MNKKTIAAILMTSILCIASCSNNTPATTTTVANTTTTTAAETTENTTTETVEDTAETTESDSEDLTYETDPLNETVLEKNVSANYQSAYDQYANILAHCTYTYVFDMDISTDNKTSSETIEPVSEIDLTIKCILNPDLTITKFNNTDMYRVDIPSNKTNISFEDTYEITTAMVPTKENITTADIVQLPTGGKAYRFIIDPENNASAVKNTNRTFIYIDETTNYPVAMYINEHKKPTKILFKTSQVMDSRIFEISPEYTEISYSEYESMFVDGYSYADIIANRG